MDARRFLLNQLIYRRSSYAGEKVKNACDNVNETASTLSHNSVSCGQFFLSSYINKTILSIRLMSFSRLLSWRYVDVNILSMDCLDVAET